MIGRVLSGGSLSLVGFNCSFGVVSFSVDLEGEGIEPDETKSRVSASVNWKDAESGVKCFDPEVCDSMVADGEFSDLNINFGFLIMMLLPA